MRIRKRFPTPSVPLPSDPQLEDSVAAVQPPVREEAPLQQLPAAAKTCCSPPSDLPNPPPPDHPSPIRIQNSRWMFSAGFCNKMERQKELEEVKEEEQERITTGNNDSKKENFSSAHQDSLISQPFSSSFDQEIWSGRNREIPLKKRRGSGFEKYVEKEATKPRMKSKTNKKCAEENGRSHQKKKKNDDDEGAAAKKSTRGSEILEGSRCSRVNGRGWRCCQQTLVGYSLCEHHLGKGRLRSINATTARNRRNKTGDDEYETTTWFSSKDVRNYDDDNDNDERKKPSLLSTSKKRMKIGMVKARSMSSLLGQTDNLVVATKPAEDEQQRRFN